MFSGSSLAVLLCLMTAQAIAQTPDYQCETEDHETLFSQLGATLIKLPGGNIALYPLAPPDDIMRLEWANLFGAGYRAGDIYFFESSEGRHELVHTPTNTRVACLPNPASPRAIQKRPKS